MHYIQVVNCFKALDDLTQKVPSFNFAEFASDFQKLFKISSVAVLHEKVEVVDCLLDVEKCNDVWVLYSGQNAYFVFEVLLKPLIKVDLLDDFTSHPLVLLLLALV